MKKTNILYWIFTSLFAAFMAMSAIPDILVMPIAVTGMHEGLGYPVYFIPFIGVAKLLGAIAILVPGFNRLKEWAYAGLVFDLIGATFSIIAVGKTAADYGGMIVPLAFAALSYIYYHKRKNAKLVSIRDEQSSYQKVNMAGI